MADSSARTSLSLAGTGVTGLDYVLHGGLPRQRIFLLHGGPGTGKTTLGMQFLMEGARQGERTLYITLLQTRDEVLGVADSHGWTLAGVELLELPENVQETAAAEQTIFRTGEVELHEVMDAIIEAIKTHRPQRLLLDSVSELAVLVDNPYQLRRQLIKLKRTLADVQCTALFTLGMLDQELASLQTMVHGVIELNMHSPVYGRPRRSLEVTKMRGRTFVGGYHDYQIATGGLVVYPRLKANGTQDHDCSERSTIASGNMQFDAMLGGGLEEGTACLITGTSGVGKSTLTSLYAQAAAERGDRSLILCFDERKKTFLRRAQGLEMALPRYVEQGLIDLRQYDVGQISPGELMQAIRCAVDEQAVKIVVLDSITGYLNAMPDEHSLILQLHELLSYLGDQGVLTLLVVSAQNTFGGARPTVSASYLADTVVVMRYFEAQGQVRRCIAVLKKRHGSHESAIREVSIGRGGIQVGEPLTQFSGVLTGTPKFEGSPGALLDRSAKGAKKEQDEA